MVLENEPYLYGTSIVKKLVDAGYQAFFAGGWVRDLLRGEKSDEIDIATSAPPEVILSLFPKTVPVGIAFGVVIVVINNINFEVSTFRKDLKYIDGRHPESVEYSHPEEDAKRRDFTINGMFYDPLKAEIIDFVEGKRDLKKKIIRAIGNPNERFFEDRLRMIRAVRFAARFNFTIERKTENAIARHSHLLLPAVSMERVWQEFCKMSKNKRFGQAILMLHRFGLLQVILPPLKRVPDYELAKRVKHFPHFPSHCPTIIYLLHLFPTLELASRLALCRYFKTTVKEQKLVEFFTQSEKLFAQKEVEPADWAHFYAEAEAPLFLQVYAAPFSNRKRKQFFKLHEERERILSFHIDKIRSKRPLVSAALLLREGITPGKEMGTLLKSAERMAINNNWRDPEHILEKLKQTFLWPR